MKYIQPKKKDEILVQRPGEYDGMSVLERKMNRTTESKTFLQKMDPFGIFKLQEHADNFQKDIEKSVKNII